MSGGIIFTVTVLLLDGRLIEFEVLAASHEAAEDIALEQAEHYYHEHPIGAESITIAA